MKHIPTITRLLAIMAVMALHINTNAMTLSPNGKVRWNETKGTDDKVNFSIEYMDKDQTMQILAVTAFGLTTRDGGGHEIKMSSTAERRHHDSYTMLSGKRLQCFNDANEVTYTFTDNLGREQMMDVRVYNDGIAFRYRLNNLLHTRVAEELTTYRLREGMRRWMMKWSESYEDFFPPLLHRRVQEQALGIPCPDTAGGQFMGLDNRGWSGTAEQCILSLERQAAR